jgi:hypothetical protein
MISISYPFSTTMNGRDYLAELGQILSPQDLAKIAMRMQKL